MRKWLSNAIRYVDEWLDFQMRLTRQPGCVLAFANKGRITFEKAYGHADIARRQRMTPRHRFRVASHSKSFTATAILRLKEEGKLRLDEPVGAYVEGLHPSVSSATLSQLLSHGAGVVRDGRDAGQWIDERSFADEAELRAALAQPLVIPSDSRMKYSNHGFGLLGLVIESVTGETYGSWVARNVLRPSGLGETTPDMPIAGGAPLARGHGTNLPLDRRYVIPADNPTHALAAATGFVSTAGDLVRFFASLDPDSPRSVLTPESRRALIRWQWRDPHSSEDGGYGLGMCLGFVGGLEWAGHGGAFQGVRSRTVMLPGSGISFSVLTNATDGPAEAWADGIIRILRTFRDNPIPGSSAHSWTGRWWSSGEAVDLVAFGNRVLVAQPDRLDPFNAADEITLSGEDQGTISLSGGYGIHGEPARLERGRDGKVKEVWFGGFRWVGERRHGAELKRKYMGRQGRPRRFS
ncbi:MAG: serine hydrolase [bacterium]|nr:serine hydrolase [bacterium]